MPIKTPRRIKPRTMPDYVHEMHDNGVHTACHHAPRRPGNPRGSAGACPRAGTVERFHSHDFDGPLACGCDDFDAD